MHRLRPARGQTARGSLSWDGRSRVRPVATNRCCLYVVPLDGFDLEQPNERRFVRLVERVEARPPVLGHMVRSAASRGP
jgi:hypothetical protein